MSRRKRWWVYYFFWPYHDRFWINRRGLTEGVHSGAIKKRLILIPTSPLPFHCDTLFEWNSSPPLWPDTRASIGSCRIAFSIAFCCWWCCCCCCCFIIIIIIIIVFVMLNYQPIKELQLSAEQEKEYNLLRSFFFFVFCRFYCLDTFVPI